MSETSQIILGLSALLIVYILTRKFHVWRIKRAYMYIIKDLERKEAFDPSSGIKLPYAKKGLIQLGTRDYRPQALEQLIASGIVGRTDSGNYYLKKRDVGLIDAERGRR